MSGHDDFAKALEAIMAERRKELGGPPTPEEILAYRDGQLDAEARQQVEEKIAVYPEAARALADLAAFPEVEPGPETPELSDEEIAARWQTFRPRLEEDSKVASMPAPVPRIGERRAELEATHRRRSFPWRLPAAAALLLSACLASYLAGRAAEPAPERRLTPALNVTIAELAPIEEDGVRAPAENVEMLAGSEGLLLILTSPEIEESTAYAAEILDSQGLLLWSGGGLRPTAFGTFQLSFPRESLAPGTYRINLFGQEESGSIADREPLASYELRVTSGAAPR